jgi:hypothetical protein
VYRDRAPLFKSFFMTVKLKAIFQFSILDFGF